MTLQKQPNRIIVECVPSQDRKLMMFILRGDEPMSVQMTMEAVINFAHSIQEKIATAEAHKKADESKLSIVKKNLILP